MAARIAFGGVVECLGWGVRTVRTVRIVMKERGREKTDLCSRLVTTWNPVKSSMKLTPNTHTLNSPEPEPEPALSVSAILRLSSHPHWLSLPT